jgi:3-oxoacyl-[acyl-carrier-protein] synthase-1
MRRVVVTGVGAVSPLGSDAATVSTSLREGRSGLVYVPEMERLGLGCAVYGQVRDFDPGRLSRRALQTLSPAGQYALAAALEAVGDAGLHPADLAGERTGVVVGTMLGGIEEATHQERLLRERRSPSRLGATGVVKIMNSTASGNLAAYFGVRGRAYSVSSACSTGPDSIGHAYELIALGLQDVCLAGATEEDCWRQLGPSYDNWHGMPVGYNDRPAAACRPYDRDRQGLVIASGAGVLVLEELERARRRDAPIYAELVGYGSANDGSDMFHPAGDGSLRAARQALRQAAKRGVVKMDYINTHGTATKVGDAVEIRWLRELFGPDVPPLSSTKGLSGHAMGAAGALEAVYTLLMLRHGFIAPTANLEHVDPDCDGVPHVRTFVERPIAAALSLSAGLGGTNSCLVFRRL